MSMTRIDLIRHGEPVGGNIFRGSTDHQLTDFGRQQFHARIARTAGGWDQIISSPLQRCLASAQELSAKLNVPLQVDERFREIDFGDWEGQPLSSVLANPSVEASRLWDDPLNFCAPQGESVQLMQRRVLAGWQALSDNHQGKHLLLVCHGGVMRVLAQHLLKLAPEAMNSLAIPYAGLLRFKLQHSEFRGKAQTWAQMEGMDGEEILER